MRKKKEAEIQTEPVGVSEPAITVTNTTTVKHAYKKFEVERTSTNGTAADVVLREKPEWDRWMPMLQSFHVRFSSPADFIGFAQWVNEVANDFLENATEGVRKALKESKDGY